MTRLEWFAELARSVLEKDPRPEELQTWEAEHRDPWIPARRYYRFLYEAARLIRPAVIVELGTDSGYGTIHLARGHPAGLIVSIDITHERIEERAEHVLYLKADSTSELAVGTVKALGPVGLILFDSLHTQTHVAREFELYDPLCESGALQLFDDIEESPSMRLFWEELPEPKLSIPELHPTWQKGRTPGFGIRVKP
jgi:predicted O-methyltransferase YrrM